MPDDAPGPIDTALARLVRAVVALEGALARHLEVGRATALEAELALMQDDRARLALELDGALARAGRVAAAEADLARRIDRAIGQVRAVLESSEQAG